MDKKEVLEVIKELKKEEHKKNFAQSFDFQVRLQNIDVKKQENKVDLFVDLPHGRGKKVSVCALIGGTLYNDAKTNCDKTIVQDEFKAMAGNTKELKKLARSFDFFIAQADIMGQVAGTFGRFLGPKGRMPNPKAGCVIPPKGSIKPVVEKLQNTIRLIVKNNELAVKCSVGTEKMDDEKVAENVVAAYNALVHSLPMHEQNIKNVSLKLTMSKPLSIGGKK
jgi:large subunit ribosomal protein L1